MTGTLKIKRRSRKSVIYNFNELFCGRINPCYEHFEPDMLDTSDVFARVTCPNL